MLILSHFLANCGEKLRYKMLTQKSWNALRENAFSHFRKVNYDLLATNLIEDESVVDRIQFYPSKVI